MLPNQTISVPMRDGVKLSTDLYLPESAAPAPLILMRTPYRKERFADETLYSHPERFTAAGYIVAVQDCRGTGTSEGVMNLNGKNEHDDGYDAIEWLAAQPFCNGRVGMFGLSYFGFTQLSAAATRPPHLCAICPFMTMSMEPFSASRMHTTNVFHISWAYGQLLGSPEHYLPDPEFRAKVLPVLQENFKRLGEWSTHLPMDEHPAAGIAGVPMLGDYIDLQRGIEDEDFWKELRIPLNYDHSHVPMFFGTGWMDAACAATLDGYRAARACADPVTRENARLLIGPWPHGGMLPGQVEDVDFGAGNDGEGQDVAGMMLRFFDHWLKGENVEPFDARVRYYVTGSGEWRVSPDWPPKSQPLSLFLAPEFALAPDAPAEKHADHYRYDPMNPAPSGIQDSEGRRMAADWREVSRREDVLTYAAAPCEEMLTIAGEIRLRLYAQTDAPDTDFACRLLDIAPDGRETELTAGLVRAKYRKGMFNPQPVPQNEPVCYDLTVGNTAHTFLPGHSVGIQITSSMFPKHNRNLNTGKPATTSSEIAVANQQILLGDRTPSCLTLPVISE